MNTIKTLFFLPSRNLALTIPLTLAVGFAAGLLLNTASLKSYILPVSVLMIYPTMIGFRIGEMINLRHGRLVLHSLGLNFLAVPLLAYVLGTAFLLDHPGLFAGLAIAALLPTANMTIAYTMFARGNVPASVKLTVISLVSGSLLMPWYLLAMVGRYVPIDVAAVLQTLVVVVFLPLAMGTATYSLLLRRYTPEQFNRRIKPYLPATTAWGMVFIIFTSISNNAEMIVGRPHLVLTALGVQILFYAANYLLATSTGRRFRRPEAIALVYATALRNLPISMGLAFTAFGPDAALMVAFAFLLQGQAGAWFMRLEQKYGFFPERVPDQEKQAG